MTKDVRQKQQQSHQEDTLKAYFEQIKKSPLLSFEEELDLSRRIQKGDHEARSRLIECNLRLVVKVAKSFACPDVSFLDLVQEGNLGLVRAAAKYDHRKEVRFSTYASWWIKQAITRALANKRRPIRLPHRKEEALRRIQHCYNTLSQRLMRKPSVDEVAEEVGMARHEVVEIMGIAGSPASLDGAINEDAGTLHDVCEDYSYSPDTNVLREATRDGARRILEKLDEREQRILTYRFALDGGKRRTLKRISSDMGISPETVRQIEIKALKKLRRHAEELKEYV